MSNYDKQYQEDLERAQALSLESLALEQFKNKKLQELNKSAQENLKLKNTAVARASSMNETDSVQIKYDRQASRPRPGGSSSNPGASLIAPPPTSQRKPSSASSISESPDLISFSSPPATTNDIINFCNQQVYNSNPLMISGPMKPYLWIPTHSGLYNPNNIPVNQSNWYRTQYDNGNFGTNVAHLTSHLSTPSPVRNFSAVPQSMSMYPNHGLVASTPIAQTPPPLVPKKQERPPPPIPSTSSNYLRQKQNQHNLIDLVHPSDTNSVRVSILQEFDPILSDSSNLSNSTLRTISPDYSADDTASVCDSVYDEYDPYQYIYSGSGNNSLSDPLYAAVIKSENTPQSPPPPIPPRVRMSTIETENLEKKKWNLLDKVQRIEDRSNLNKDTDLKAFYEMLFRLRSRYKYNDANTNMGLVISPMINLKYQEGLSIKLCVHPDFEGADFNKPYSLTCDVTSSVEHVTLQLKCEWEAPSKDEYTLKVWGYNEYLAPTTFLSDYEYVHNCIKLEEDVVLILIPDSKVDKSFARTRQDDFRDKEITFNDIVPYELETHIKYESLIIILETVESEMLKLEQSAEQFQERTNPSVMPASQPSQVLQSVKYVINLMGNICNFDLIEAVESLERRCSTFPTYNEQNLTFAESVKLECNKIRLAIQNLIEMYSKAFIVDFEIIKPDIPNEPVKGVQNISDPVLIRVCSIYRPSAQWKHDEFVVVARIYHGYRPIGKPVLSCSVKKVEQNKKWPERIHVDHWFEFEDTKINLLSRESRLVLVIHGRTLNTENQNDGDKPKYDEEEIGWAAIQFFNYENLMIQGSMLLSIWPMESNFLTGPAPAVGTNIIKDHPMIGVEIVPPSKIKFPEIPTTINNRTLEFQSLDKQTQEVLLDVCEQNMLNKIRPEIREVLWEKRHYLYKLPSALPKVLLAAHSWAYMNVSELHGMLDSWEPLKPIRALELLLPTFPDMAVRKKAVRWIHAFTNDELVDYLPQFVVALRFETYENSPLAQFLLECSLRSPRFAHYLFWLLSHKLPGSLPQNCSSEITEKEECEPSEMRYLRRLKLMLRSLLAICGESLRNCFLSQQLLVKILNDAAINVQKTKEAHKLTLLHNEMQGLDNQLNQLPTSLPLSPTLRVTGVQVDSCSYFPSNTLPLKINFIMKDSSIIPAIYKVGDDLQQDMLTLQIVRLMDKLWLHKGIDLKMVTFNCIPTGHKRGMIELVKKAETLRKIQVEHGLTGSFKDKPIAEWLAKHNPSELEYRRAVENFTASCAGYCVVTYVLGICDRHNDNIMLKTSGHLFHIDFGKFLGDAQMFGNFKRDRVPFVLTSDMAYVINGGDRPTEKFHRFVDLCCQAFNVIRDNADLLLCIFTMMASSGISGVTIESVSYIQKALLPELSNPEAAANFARMIQSSLKSWFTQFNFFLHNLAQLKFSNETNSDSLLSFVPKTYNMDTDGKLVHVEVKGFRKRYDPDKYYVYLLNIYRENQNQPMEIQRTYKEFCELHQKLCLYFPLAQLYSLSNGLKMGRSNIKQVASKRYYEISSFVESLFKCAFEIAHSDLVYTFFHPLLRDQQDQEDYSKKLKDRNSIRNDVGQLRGQLKLSLHYSKQALTVMVHHVRGLPKLNNGQEPSTYVKVYLKPDPNKDTKRKTKVVRKNCHPSFMEMLEYRMPKDILKLRKLQATVWNYDALQENEYMGGIELDLKNLDLDTETTEWYPLVNLSR